MGFDKGSNLSVECHVWFTPNMRLFANLAPRSDCNLNLDALPT